MKYEKIGIIGAMRVEIETLSAALENAETEKISGIEFHTGKLCGCEVVLAVCGIGKVFAALCAQTMILHFGVRALINTGVAGTLTDSLSMGNLAVASDVVQHDMDTSPLGDPVGWVSGLDLIHIPADPELGQSVIQILSRMGEMYRFGTIASGDVFVADPKQKKYIRDTFGAIACEMEGAAIGQVCFVNHIPFAVIRAISDGGDDQASLDYPAFVKMAAQKSASVVCALLRG